MIEEPRWPTPPSTIEYGPEYGLEAIRRLRAGFAIVYRDDGLLVEEHPDGRRFEIGIARDGAKTFIRELT